jgi:hypothetical protein
MFWRKHYVSKHTGKEIDDAVDAVQALPEDVIGNPMTASGDLIVGGTDGEPEKLAAGSQGQVLKVGASGLEWASDAAGMENPMTTLGDIIVGGASGAPGRVGLGTAGDLLRAGAAGPEYGKGLPYITTAPEADNTSGIIICVLAAEPATKHNGYLYIITGS